MSNNKDPSSDIILYSSPEGNITVKVIYSGETFWLTQKRMAELFGVEVPAVSKHLKNIFETGELQEDAVISKMETTAVGYRFNSKQGTQFSPTAIPNY